MSSIIISTSDGSETISVSDGSGNSTTAVTVTDNMAFPASLVNPTFTGLLGNPFVIDGNNVGLQLTDPQYGLHISGSLFAPVISGSSMQIQGASATDLFIVKAHGSEDSKFVINLHGVTILGQFTTTPPFADGGMFYSSSGDFYLGS